MTAHFTVYTMGNTSSASASVTPTMKNAFRIERLVVGLCDFLPETLHDRNIRVGLVPNPNVQNPLGHQAIKIGETGPYRLQAFTETSTSLHYNFEENVSFTLMKRRESIVYQLKTPDMDITREVDPVVQRMYKTIGMGDTSQELDKIQTLYRMA